MHIEKLYFTLPEILERWRITEADLIYLAENDRLRLSVRVFDLPVRGMKFTPKGYGGRRRDPEQVKREGWHEQRMLAVSLDDRRLTWPEREMVRQLGERLYGTRDREVRHD